MFNAWHWWWYKIFNTLSTNPTKWSNTLKQFFGKLSTNYLSVFDHFAGLALKGLTELPTTNHLSHLWTKLDTLPTDYWMLNNNWGELILAEYKTNLRIRSVKSLKDYLETHSFRLGVYLDIFKTMVCIILNMCYRFLIWFKVFKNLSSKIYGRQPLKHLKRKSLRFLKIHGIEINVNLTGNASIIWKRLRNSWFW